MQWTQVDIATSPTGIEPLTAALEELGVTGFSIRDSADFAALLREGRWDYIDEGLLPLAGCESSVTFYLAGTAQDQALLEEATALVARHKREKNGAWGRLEITLAQVEDEDWASSWKKHWKPTRVGRALVVCPTWEQYAAAPGETVLRLDPGAAFGSGTHQSTRLCMELCEAHISGGEKVLDLGSGSGILAITALLLGARSAYGVDIGEGAVQAARANAAVNGLKNRCAFAVGDLAGNVTETFDIVFANLVADLIIRLAPDAPRLLSPGGILIASGIIGEREVGVAAALERTGLRVAERREDGGWVALAVRNLV